MNRSDAASENDPLLLPLLEARDDEQRDRAIERLLVASAQPLTARILSRTFRSHGQAARDREDVAATVQLRLLGKLRKLAAGETAGIRQFDDYVARLTYNALNDHLRRRYPQLTALKNQIRYILTHDSRFALWPHGDELAAGLAEWRERRIGVLHEPPVAVARSAAVLPRDRADALASVFRSLGAPLVLQALVRLLAELWQVSDDVGDVSMPLVDRQPPASEQLERRQYLRALWSEIESLGPNHRKALLLNLRDDQTVNVISIFVLSGVASFDQIAASLQMDGNALAELWSDLPLDDLRIAGILGTTRQQVINLRKTARNRLARRLPRGGGKEKA